jgi:hypothetical protein
LLGQLNAAQNTIDRSRLNIIENGNRSNDENRVELDRKFKKACIEIISSIHYSK